jgi:hypothetical protein
MRKTIAALALAAVAAGCGQKITADEARNAIPDQNALLIDTPKDAADASAAIAAKPGALTVAAVTSEPAFQPGFPALTNSDYARWSYVTAWTVNGGTWWTLKLIHAITSQFPATDCSDDTCTWGPWTGEEGNTWRLTVRRVEDGVYDYVLAGVSTGGEWLPLVSGVARPSAPKVGSGRVTLYFDNARQLPSPSDDHGTLAVEYDTAASPRRVTAEIVGARDEHDGNPLSAAYAFEAGAAGGDLQVAFAGADDQQNPVSLSLHTRWDSTGAGRGDAKLIVEDEGGVWTLTGGASECWAGASGDFQLTWDTDPAFGDVSACAAAFQGDPQYSTLVAP